MTGPIADESFSGGYRFLIVVTTGENADFIFIDLVNKAVFFIDTAGPAPGKLMFEWFGLAGAGERIFLDFLDQLEDAKGLFAVFFHPPGQIFKAAAGVKVVVT